MRSGGGGVVMGGGGEGGEGHIYPCQSYFPRGV